MMKLLFEKGKKPLYEREICPDLENPSRCKECCFWTQIKRVDITTGKNLKESGKAIPKKNLESMYVIETSGCSVLTEICPECIVDLTNERQNKLVGFYDLDNNHENINCKPAFALPNDNDKKSFYCKLCKKTYNHSELKHLVHARKIVEVEKLYQNRNLDTPTNKKENGE